MSSTNSCLVDSEGWESNKFVLHAQCQAEVEDCDDDEPLEDPEDLVNGEVGGELKSFHHLESLLVVRSVVS